jgi:hypothetical protein
MVVMNKVFKDKLAPVATGTHEKTNSCVNFCAELLHVTFRFFGTL